MLGQFRYLALSQFMYRVEDACCMLVQGALLLLAISLAAV
jgi:hypothetical protein